MGKYNLDRVICRDRVIPIIQPAVATIETPIIEESCDVDSGGPQLPPTRKGSLRSIKNIPGLDEIIVDESMPRNNHAFKRVFNIDFTESF